MGLVSKVIFLLAGLALSSTLVTHVRAQLKAKVYGVNLGSWLVLEPWMLPQEWLDMGGQSCAVCSTCIASEWSFAKAYPHTVDAKFAQHWDTWFTQNDVNTLKAAGINTVRVPLGYWIVEALVDRPHESYPQGGLAYLRRGLLWLRDAGIQVILDHHALPGVQTPGQQFTGNCTDDVQFYTPYNYNRALVWTAVMTALSHLDPNFGSVFAIEAINEPIMNADSTPDYGTFQKNFVITMRAVESILGISTTLPSLGVSISNSNNFTAALSAASSSNTLPKDVKSALASAASMLEQIAEKYDLKGFLEASSFQSNSRSSLTTNFMDVSWQYNNPSNPADVAMGPQAYDNHLYYSFGGVADANPTAYMTSICNLQRIENDSILKNAPLWFGEWGLATQFNATDDFLRQWADGQKWAYSKSAGWIYWNFKVENSNLTNGNALARQWSYLEAVELGYMTKDPSQLHDPGVCLNFITNTGIPVSAAGPASSTAR